MLIVRDVFNAKYGHGDELVGLFREMKEMGSIPSGFRVLVDASGPFFQVITEMEMADFTAWQNFTAAEMAHPDFAAWFGRMMPLVESGHRNFYTVVEL